MASVAQPAGDVRADVRTIVGGGVKLGVLTAVGVVVFALLSRRMDLGTAEFLLQSALVLVGAAVASYLPAHWIRSVDADSIAWAALLGLLGALSFTVIDTALLRPLDVYHWTWDAIGGGSGFWYIPVWWILSAILAWLGAWVYAISQSSPGVVSIVAVAGRTIALAIVLLVILVATDLAPAHAAIAALSYGLALVVQVPITAMLQRR